MSDFKNDFQKPILEELKSIVVSKLKDEYLLEKQVLIKARVLSAEEAIGNPEKYDFPLLKGKEKIMEADFCGNRGHAYTDLYGGFRGSLSEIFNMDLSNNYRRALQVASINALAKYWGMADDTVHCKDEQPGKCALKSSAFVEEKYPGIEKIAFIGYQPAFVDIFSKKYRLKVLDLDQDNIGQNKFGNIILDGNKDMEEAVNWAELVFSTGSVLTNGSIDNILKLAGERKVLFYGVTISGTAAIMGLNRICFTE